MIQFPQTLTKIPHYPGYFWCVDHHELYSIKIAGVLRKLSPQKAWRTVPAGYDISYKGRRIRISRTSLLKLRIPEFTEFVDHAI